jgi:hypothetical protein
MRNPYAVPASAALGVVATAFQAQTRAVEVDRVGVLVLLGKGCSVSSYGSECGCVER